MKIYANGRFRAHRVTGVQRYSIEITDRLAASLTVLAPERPLKGLKGHLWEQGVLPAMVQTGVLWSPCAAGPVFAKNHVVTFHDLFPIDCPQWYRRSYSTAYSFLLSRLARGAKHLIAVSNYTKKRLVDKLMIDPSKVTVIHNGIDRRCFHVASNEAVAAAKSSLQLPSSRYLLCLGSLEARKNLKRLLEAWSKVVGELSSDLWLVIAGGADKNVYRDMGLPATPARTFFTGYVDDSHLSGLYSGSSGFLFPSLAEGFGLPPLEAMACGSPVATSNTSSLPEICGPAALYVDPESTADIAKAIKILASDTSAQDRLRALGTARVQAFNWDTAASQTLNVLQSVAASS